MGKVEQNETVVPADGYSAQIRSGHLEAAAIVLARVSDLPGAMDLLRHGSRAAAERAIEDYLATLPTAEDYEAMEP